MKEKGGAGDGGVDERRRGEAGERSARSLAVCTVFVREAALRNRATNGVQVTYMGKGVEMYARPEAFDRRKLLEGLRGAKPPEVLRHSTDESCNAQLQLLTGSVGKIRVHTTDAMKIVRAPSKRTGKAPPRLLARLTCRGATSQR